MAMNGNASEYRCTRFPDCTYSVSTMTGGGYDFPSECGNCGADLERL